MTCIFIVWSSDFSILFGSRQSSLLPAGRCPVYFMMVDVLCIVYLTFCLVCHLFLFCSFTLTSMACLLICLRFYDILDKKLNEEGLKLREGQGIKRKRRLGTTICMSNLKWGAASSIWRRKRSIPTVIQCPVFYIRQQMVLMQKYPHLNPEAEMITLSLVRIQTNCLYCSCSSFIYTVTFY
ncbi:uncharacterized protein LOC119301459 [Triticum dicoccoides]|uniref:uncharacterized protein LOC119301459 n=1 Tax=Triticum dicoccoides TaxID=85692 RepID=UPI00188F9946|nr:uncharacterized protein LOC119301459 [Triticum dicoccoides]